MKKFLLMILAMILALNIVACSPTGADPSSNSDAGGDDSSQSTGDNTGDNAASGSTILVSLGWTENASGQRILQSYEENFAMYGITDYNTVDANYDAKRQSEQIEAMIAQNPAAIMFTPSDPIGIADAVQKAVDAGIPVFSTGGQIPGVAINTTIMSDSYASGKVTMTALADALLEKYPGTEDIEIAMIDLPNNEDWDARGQGARYILSQEQYSRIKVTHTWSWDSTGAVTPRNAVDSFLAADPDNNLKAIWCAWDGAVFEGLEATAETRPEIMYVGSDGGRQAYEKMAQYPEQFILTVAESPYLYPQLGVMYANQFLSGERVPRLVIVPSYYITSEMVTEAYELSDVMYEGTSVWDLACEYDVPGNVDKLNAALEENGMTTRWEQGNTNF